MQILLSLGDMVQKPPILLIKIVNKLSLCCLTLNWYWKQSLKYGYNICQELLIMLNLKLKEIE